MNQPDLFGNDEARRRLETERRAAGREKAEARRKENGRAAARAGMEAVKAKAEAVRPGWTDHAYSFLLAYARDHALFTGEEVKAWAYREGCDRPHNEGAWGPVMNRARARKVVRFDGYATASSASRHGAPNRRWRSLLYKGEQE